MKIILQGNNWLWTLNGVNILVDPVGNLDFGIPYLYAAAKKSKLMKEFTVICSPLFPSSLYQECFQAIHEYSVTKWLFKRQWVLNLNAFWRSVWNGLLVQLDDLPKLDCILITQGYDDHCHKSTLTAMVEKFGEVRVIASPNTEPIIGKIGYKHVRSSVFIGLWRSFLVFGVFLLQIALCPIGVPV